MLCKTDRSALTWTEITRIARNFKLSRRARQSWIGWIEPGTSDAPLPMIGVVHPPVEQWSARADALKRQLIEAITTLMSLKPVAG